MKFKNLWIKPTEEETERQDGSAGMPDVVPPPRQTIVASGDLSAAPFQEQLEDALEKANLPSQQDYLDFAKALKNMDALPMDEATKYRAAFATLQSFGCNLAQLLDSFDYYNGILDGERDKFDEALRSKVKDSVVGKEDKVKQLTGQNQDNAADIEKLTAQVTANQQAIAQLQNELADINAKLKRQEGSFNAAFNTLKQRLQTDAQKINTYLGPVAASQSTASTRKK